MANKEKPRGGKEGAQIIDLAAIKRGVSPEALKRSEGRHPSRLPRTKGEIMHIFQEEDDDTPA